MVAAVRQFSLWIAAPNRQVRIAGLCTVLWLILSPITMLTALRASIPWLTAASLFANVATCFGWWVAAWANQRASNVEARTDEMASLQHIEQLTEGIAAVAEQLQRVDSLHGDQLARILEALHGAPPSGNDGPLPSSPLRNLLGQ